MDKRSGSQISPDENIIRLTRLLEQIIGRRSLSLQFFGLTRPNRLLMIESHNGMIFDYEDTFSMDSVIDFVVEDKMVVSQMITLWIITESSRNPIEFHFVNRDGVNYIRGVNFPADDILLD